MKKKQPREEELKAMAGFPVWLDHNITFPLEGRIQSLTPCPQEEPLQHEKDKTVLIERKVKLSTNEEVNE